MVAKIAYFGHKYGKGFGKWAAHPQPTFLGVPPPPHPGTLSYVAKCVTVLNLTNSELTPLALARVLPARVISGGFN